MKDSVDLNKVNMRELLKNMGVPMSGGHGHPTRQGMGSPLDHDNNHYTGDTQPGFGFNSGSHNGKFKELSGLANYGAQDQGTGRFANMKGCLPSGGRRTRRKGKSSRRKKGKSSRRKSNNKYGGYGETMSCTECGSDHSEGSCNSKVSYGFKGGLGNDLNIAKWGCAGCNGSGGRRSSRKSKKSSKSSRKSSRKSGGKRNKKTNRRK
jgi:hypothetical protein